MTLLIRFLICLLPWVIRRPLLCLIYGYEIAPTARIKFSWVFPKKLVMAAGSLIDTGTVIKGVEEVILEENSQIGRLNWITGEPLTSSSFQQTKRTPRLWLKKESSITNRHLIDCTDSITVGEYSIVAGFRTQLLTHSIDLQNSSQNCHPILIGSYCFIGTGVIILGGSRLPDYSVLGAGAVLNRVFEEPYSLYAGTPAKLIKSLDKNSKYFHRPKGYVE